MMRSLMIEGLKACTHKSIFSLAPWPQCALICRWLRVCSQLESHDDFILTQQAIEAFRQNEGPKLQEHLIKRSVSWCPYCCILGFRSWCCHCFMQGQRWSELAVWVLDECCILAQQGASSKYVQALLVHSLFSVTPYASLYPIQLRAITTKVFSWKSRPPQTKSLGQLLSSTILGGLCQCLLLAWAPFHKRILLSFHLILWISSYSFFELQIFTQDLLGSEGLGSTFWDWYKWTNWWKLTI